MDQDPKARYVQHVEAIRREYGDQAAICVRALASLRHVQLTTLALLEELDQANILAPGCADTVHGFWSVAESQTVHAMLGPLIADLEDNAAAAMAQTLIDTAKILAALPLETSAVH